MKRAVYAGSFDPPTRGHLDIIWRASKLFDEVVVVVAENPEKEYVFESWERVNMLRDMVRNLPNVLVREVNGPVGEYARRIGATVFVRGLRDEKDWQDEQQLLALNRLYFSEMETVYLVATQPWISSSAAKKAEEAERIDPIKCGPELISFVTYEVAEMLRLRMKERRGN
ncbi:phosphopantetheine adenylyltransferase [Myxococcus phage Mx1]|nr:phosphopantetheine adenylyltransferase [Myxococcus phage Mx1]